MPYTDILPRERFITKQNQLQNGGERITLGRMGSGPAMLRFSICHTLHVKPRQKRIRPHSGFCPPILQRSADRLFDHRERFAPCESIGEELVVFGFPMPDVGRYGQQHRLFVERFSGRAPADSAVVFETTLGKS